MRTVLTPTLVLLVFTATTLWADNKDRLDNDKKDTFELVGGKTLPEWIKELNHLDPSQKRDAIQAVQMFKDNYDCTKTLIYILRNDPDSTLRSNAAVALMNVGVSPGDVPKVIEALTEQMEKNFQVSLRYYCAMALGRFGGDAKNAMLPLIRATTDKGSWEIRQAACMSLTRIFTDPDEKVDVDLRAVRAFVVALNDPAAKVRQEALIGILSMGVPSDRDLQQQLIAQLLKRLQDKEKFIVVWAYYGLLMNTGVNDTYLNALTNLLKKGDVPTRVQAIRALGMLGKDAKSKIPDIVAAVADSDQLVAGTACMTLATMNEKISTGQASIDAVKKLLDEKKPDDPMRKHIQHFYDVLTGKKALGKTDKR